MDIYPTVKVLEPWEKDKTFVCNDEGCYLVGKVGTMAKVHNTLRAQSDVWVLVSPKIKGKMNIIIIMKK